MTIARPEEFVDSRLLRLPVKLLLWVGGKDNRRSFGTFPELGHPTASTIRSVNPDRPKPSKRIHRYCRGVKLFRNLLCCWHVRFHQGIGPIRRQHLQTWIGRCS
jgi:hypothetical protein